MCMQERVKPERKGAGMVRFGLSHSTPLQFEFLIRSIGILFYVVRKKGSLCVTLSK